MKRHDVNRSDHLKAGILSAASAVVHSSQALEQRFMNPGVPNYEGLRWRRSYANAASIDWVEVPAYEASGNLAKDYQQSAVLTSTVDNLSRLRADFSCNDELPRDAVAYRLGTAVMVGVFNAGQYFGLHPAERDVEMVAFGVGKGVLNASMGIWTLGHDFVPSPNVELDIVVPNQDLQAFIPRV